MQRGQTDTADSIEKTNTQTSQLQLLLNERKKRKKTYFLDGQQGLPAVLVTGPTAMQKSPFFSRSGRYYRQYTHSAYP